jgi:hypothetical protein
MVPVELLYLAIQECIFMYILSFYAYVTMSNMKQEIPQKIIVCIRVFALRIAHLSEQRHPMNSW